MLLRREGWKVNAKRVLRLYRLEDLQIRTKRRKKRASASRLPLPIPQGQNDLWVMDFMADRLATGAKFRTLNVLARLDAPVRGHRCRAFVLRGPGDRLPR